MKVLFIDGPRADQRIDIETEWPDGQEYPMPPAIIFTRDMVEKSGFVGSRWSPTFKITGYTRFKVVNGPMYNEGPQQEWFVYATNKQAVDDYCAEWNEKRNGKA